MDTDAMIALVLLLALSQLVAYLFVIAYFYSVTHSSECPECKKIFSDEREMHDHLRVAHIDETAKIELVKQKAA